MEYEVRINKRILRNLKKLPKQVSYKLQVLVNDLRESGPVQPYWPSYSKLSDTEYHCHLGYKWVACWRCERDSIIIEVYYAGSRENAPY